MKKTITFLLLHMLVINFAVSNPSWTRIPRHTVAMAGGSTTLYCAADGLGSTKPAWLKRVGKDLIQFSSGETVSPTDCPTSCSITGDSDDGEYHMTFNPVTAEKHGGLWLCEVLGASPENVEISLTVFDEYPTCSTNLPTEHKIISGNSVTFTCSLNGAAPPGEMVWMRNNTAVARGNQPLVSTIQITKEDKYDTYDCKYHHDTLSPSPTCESSIRLDVQYPPIILVTIGGDTQNGTIKEDQELTAECKVIDANPDPSVAWTRNDSPVISLAGTITFTKIERKDSGIYKCTATNDFYDDTVGKDEESFTVDVQYKPDNIAIVHDSDGKVIETHTFQATCTADSNPTASYVWKNQANDQVGTDATLIMENINKDEAGEYTCEATNQLFDGSRGSASTNIAIDVQYPPIITVTIEGGNREGKVKEDYKFAANCTVIDANPDPSIVWHKDESIYVDRGLLAFDTIQRSSSGVYNCTATNNFHNGNSGMDSKSIRIDVQYAPEPPDIVYFNQGIVIEGNTFNATCKGKNGNPSEYTYTWTTNGSVLPWGQMLEIVGINRKQAGRYICITTNRMYDGSEGTASKTMEIDVQYLPTHLDGSRYAAEVGQTVTMSLTVDANPLPAVFGEWVLGNITLNKTDSPTTSVVKIVRVTEQHFGTYNISVENDVGLVMFSVSLEAKGAPESPSLQLLKQHYESITLEIVPGFHGGDKDSLLYYLEYRPKNNGSFQLWQTGSKDTVLVVENLTPGSTYEFQAYALNSQGKSAISDLAFYKTYGLPRITLDQETGVLSWTPHENEMYNCVMIEIKASSSNWMIIAHCIERHTNQYTVMDKTATYRVSYCVKDGTCEETTFDPVVKVPPSFSGVPVAYIIIGVFCGILVVAIIVLGILIRRNCLQARPKYLKERSVSETTFDGVDNPAITQRDTNIHGGHSHERESTTKEGNAYTGASDQAYKGQTNKTDEATTSFAVYAAPDKAKKKKNLDSHPDETPYANVTDPSTQHEPPFLTNGTDGASAYANFKEMNGSKKEPDTAYADVQMAKPEKGKPPAGGKGKKPQRKGKKATAYQAEKPYDDVPEESAKNVKPLSSSQENPYEVAAMTVQKPKPQDANVEGLTYADLDFKGGPKTKTKPKPPVKPTEDDAVAYAAVDFSKTVKPN